MKHALATLTFALLVTFLPAIPLAGEERRVTLIQRWDLRRSEDGRPVGLWHGFTQAVWKIGAPDSRQRQAVSSSWFMTQESTSDLLQVAKPLSAELRASFQLLPDGSIQAAGDGPAPFQRGFPASLPVKAQAGLVWESPGQLVVDPRGQGRWTTVPILVQYRYLRDTVWAGRPVAEVQAKYAIRYRQGLDPRGDSGLSLGQGSRESTIYLDPVSRFPVFVRERLIDETWGWTDDKRIVHNGFILSFWDGWADALPVTTGGEVLIAQASPTTSPGRPGPGPAAAAGTKTSSETASRTSTTPATTPEPASDGAVRTDGQALDLQVQPGTAEILDSDRIAGSPLPVASPGPAQSPSPTPSPSPSTSPGPVQSVSPPSLADALKKDLDSQVSSVQTALSAAKVTEVTVQADPRGLALDLGNLHFVADSAQLLAGETGRLDSIAAILRQVPSGRNFLVIGHTAAVGSESSQKKLSIERAQRIVEELKKRGLMAGRFLYDGRGGAEPIASNDTEAGKAANRRVQIIVLE